MAQTETGEQSSDARLSVRPGDVYPCRLCTQDLGARLRRLLFSESSCHVIPVLASIVGPLKTSDTGSKFVCKTCFTKLSRVSRLNLTIEKFTEERRVLLEDLNQRYSSPNSQVGGSVVSTYAPITTMPYISEKKSNSLAKRYASLSGLKRKAGDTVTPSSMKLILGQYHKILPRAISVPVMIGPAAVQEPVTEDHPPNIQKEGDGLSKIRRPLEGEHVKVKQEPMEVEPDLPSFPTEEVGVTGDLSTDGGEFVSSWLSVDKPTVNPFPVAMFGHEATSERPMIKTENEETDGESSVNTATLENQESLVNPENLDNLVAAESSKGHESSKGPESSKGSDTCRLKEQDPLNLVDHQNTSVSSLTSTVDVMSAEKQTGDDMNHKNKLLDFRLHLKEKPYKCSECDYASHLHEEVDAHVKNHSVVKPFICSVCGSGFDNKDNLISHIRIHSSEKPYKCNICGYRSNDCSNAIAHRRTHTSERRHKCPFCDYRAVCKSNVVAHLRIHTGEKPYKCPLCDYSCNTNPNLKRHMVTHTRDKTTGNSSNNIRSFIDNS